MALDIDSTSRFKFTDVIIFDGEETFGKWVPPAFVSNDNPGIYKVPSEKAGRLDLISFELYGDPSYYWTIMAANNISDINWPRAGDIIRVLPLSELIKEL